MRRLLALAFLVPCTTLAAQQTLTGYTPGNSQTQRRLEAVLQGVPDTASARRHIRELASAPHVAGTPAQMRTADYVMQQMAEFGLDTMRTEYRVFLPFQDSALVELVAPDRLRLDLTEPALPQDPATHEGVWPAMNGYSGAGDVTGPVVFVNYGLPADYAVLDSLAITVEGAVVIARYGRSFRGIKAREAEARGAAGLVLYSDPQDDGFFKGDVYPRGLMRPEQAVQRGSLYNGRGDPSTPGWPSLEGARRLPVDSMAIPTIPVVPMGYANAHQILERLEGPSVPQDWQGGLPFRYHVGRAGEGGAGRVTLRVAVWPERGERAYKTIANTFGAIRGSLWPEELVIAGAHRDAWGPGAVDNVSGTVSLLEAGRALGAALADGERPLRTIVLATWDGEEWGLVGSVEWVEAMADTLTQNAVAYLNQDVAVAGRDFGASGTASLHDFIRELTATVQQPGDSVAVLVDWRRRAGSDESGDEPGIGNLGGGSDFAGFYNHLGIPSFGFGFGGTYGVYHSAYDSYHYITTFSDPGLLSHAAAGRLASVALARLANGDIVPLDYQAFGTHLGELVDTVKAQVAELGWDTTHFAGLQQAAAELAGAGRAFNDLRDSVLLGTSPAADRLARVNRELRRVEQAMTRPEGLVARPWMRNLIFASDLDNGYATIPLPSISEAIRSRDQALTRSEVEDLTMRVRLATERVEEAGRVLAGGG